MSISISVLSFNCRALKELIGRIDKELGQKGRPKKSHMLRCLPGIIFTFCALTGGNALGLDASERLFSRFSVLNNE